MLGRPRKYTKEEVKLRKAFDTQKNVSSERGILFLLTFEEWYSIWFNSGHLHERGRKKGQYVMARYGDIGPYAVGNVRIVTVFENLKEMHLHRKIVFGRKHTEESKQKMRISSTGRKHTDETKKKIGASKPAFLGRQHSVKTKELMRKKALNRTDEQRRNHSIAVKRAIDRKKILGTYVNPAVFRKDRITKQRLKIESAPLI